ncbi:hypothetical protein [Photobacterium frigidiphilum]
MSDGKWRPEKLIVIVREVVSGDGEHNLLLLLATEPEFKGFLVKLSGRLTKRSKPVTLPSLLAGLWVFLQMCEVLDTYGL